MRTLFCIVLSLLITQQIVYGDRDSIGMIPDPLVNIEIGHWSYDAINYLDSRETFLEVDFEKFKKCPDCAGLFSKQPQSGEAFGLFVLGLYKAMNSEGYFSQEKEIDNTTLLIVKALFDEYEWYQYTWIASSYTEFGEIEILHGLEW